MDPRQWACHQLQAPVDRKRPWDPTSAVEDAGAVGPGGLDSDREDFQHKKIRPVLLPHPGNAWDPTVQTSLWLVEQGQSGRRHHRLEEPRPSYSSDDGRAPTSTFANVATDDQSLSDEQSLPRPRGRADDGHEDRNLRKDTHRAAAAHPRRPAVISAIDQRCEKCLHGRFSLQNAVSSMKKVAECLRSGPLLDSIIQSRIPHNQVPHVAKVHRILDLALEASSLAEQVLAAPSYVQNVCNADPLLEDTQRILLDHMKRKHPGDLTNKPRQASESNMSLDLHDQSSGQESGHDFSRRTSLAGVGLGGGDRLPPIKPFSPSFGSTLPSMKPPPAPGRRLQSPPARPHLSPQLPNMPSPTFDRGPTSYQPNINHPLSPAPSLQQGPTATAGAVQAHTAALQHEVSAGKYALQSLEGEHKNLQAAYGRSQIRAKTLEEKQAASDREINILSDERGRLLTQISDLEQSVSELTKSREDIRQASVKERTQYLQMLEKASQLEKVTIEEQRELRRKLKESEEAKAQAYQSGLSAGQVVVTTPGQSSPNQALPDGSVENLKREVQQLRARCSDLAFALQKIRGEAQRVSEAVTNLETTKQRILEDVDGALVDSAASQSQLQNKAST